MKAILFALILLGASCQEYIPNIGVYYESLCPGCQEFITYSYAPYYNSEWYGKANVEFVPYGNADEWYNEETGLWEFDCQHGENEVRKKILFTYYQWVIKLNKLQRLVLTYLKVILCSKTKECIISNPIMPSFTPP